MGAGTGYWAAVLQQRGISITPYDQSPAGYNYNEYHGEVPSFCCVQRGTANSGIVPKDSILMLCYPPPGTSMAVDTVQAYCGDTLIHIGEWRGLTGDLLFEQHMVLQFNLIEQLPLPYWGTDATYLTIWKRKSLIKSTASSMGNFPDHSAACGGCTYCQKERATRVCRFARTLKYCSKGCYEKDAKERAAHLSLYMISLDTPPESDLEWQNSMHFLQVDDTSHASSNQQVNKKKKRKHKHNNKKKRQRAN
mmetsp:Transcript_31871/g.46461  ORF Transcript_31871/g.46461 Transcript_31871/m.46461 type:complete len:250 (-) Transcript_31871:332-1081(-)